MTDLDLELVLAPSLLGAPPVRTNLKAGHGNDLNGEDDDDDDDDGPRSSPCKAHSGHGNDLNGEDDEYDKCEDD